MPGDSNDSLLENALAEGRREGALTLNTARLALMGGVVILYLSGFALFDSDYLKATWWIVVIHTIVAGAIFHFANQSAQVAWLSRFAVPVIDMPVVLIIQWINLGVVEDPQAAAMFTLAVFLFLTMLSALSLRERQVFAAAAVAWLFQSLLNARAGLPSIHHVSTPVMLGLTAWLVSAFPRRRLRTIHETAEREARRNRLARYFSPGVAEVIEQRDELGAGEACEISVLFADIRDFTKLSEKLDAAEVVTILNEFHGRMVEEVFRQAGTLDKYLGDGLMAYFNAPVRQPDHAVRAVKCALAMDTALRNWNEENGDSSDRQLLAGFGIHCGHAVVGAIGAPHRREFTAIGDAVNVASRLQKLPKQFDGSILVSEAIRDLAADSDLVFEAAGEVEVRGREKKVRVFLPSVKP